MKPVILLCFVLMALVSAGQSKNQQPCSSPEASQFDFWVGDWNLTWNDSLHGTNRVEKMFGNCTIHENFSDPKLNLPGSELECI